MMAERKRRQERKTFEPAPSTKAVRDPLARGCRVYERGGRTKRQGVITDLGPEVSEVTFPETGARFINNDHLINLGKA